MSRHGMCSTRRPRRGAALFEVIVACTILVVAGASAVATVSQATASATRAREADARVRTASAFLESAALWPRADLDRRLGDRAQGPWRLSIQRPSTTLYTLSLSDSGGRTLLATAVYRPDPADAGR